jgi:sulfoacetaldehyde dehydrogenase
VLDKAQRDKLQAVIWKDGHINADIVAQPAEFIAAKAGFEVPEGTTFFIVPETG